MNELFRTRMAALGSYEGESRRRTAQNIMDASWMRDAATKPVYVKWVDRGLPVVGDDDEVLYAKYNIKSYHNITGDEVAYLLQFRLEDIRNRSDIRVGSYVQICNELGNPEWWLIVHCDDRTQFVQYSILKCTWTYKWVSKVNGKRVIYNCLGAPRKQNSYNSGVWLDYTAQTVENQEVMWLPTNEDTKTIGYDTKFLKSSPGRYPALKWSITKIEDTATEGISKFTMAQTQFDPARDNVSEMIADYYESAVEPELPEMEEVPTVQPLEITYSGSPAVRAGGGYKKFTVKERVGDKLVDVTGVEWSIDFGENDVSKLTSIETDNVLKIKCTDDYYLVGQTFNLTAKCAHSTAEIIVEVIGL